MHVFQIQIVFRFDTSRCGSLWEMLTCIGKIPPSTRFTPLLIVSHRFLKHFPVAGSRHVMRCAVTVVSVRGWVHLRILEGKLVATPRNVSRKSFT